MGCSVLLYIWVNHKKKKKQLVTFAASSASAALRTSFGSAIGWLCIIRNGFHHENDTYHFLQMFPSTNSGRKPPPTPQPLDVRPREKGLQVNISTQWRTERTSELSLLQRIGFVHLQLTCAAYGLKPQGSCPERFLEVDFLHYIYITI